MAQLAILKAMARVSVKTDDHGLLKRFGLAVRMCRELRGLSQEGLADAAGIERSHMGRIERGERNVSLLNIEKIARALEMNLSDLFAGIEPKRSRVDST